VTPEEFRALEQDIPDGPGVYRYYDGEEKLMYVGKAKSLRKRVSQYFNSGRLDSERLRLLVRKIVRIETTLVNTELDALLLENSLIKQLKPRYNINLRDDKTYPYITIKNERFPRIFPTRTKVADGSTYFGPYASVGMMHAMLDLIRKLFPLRTCNLDLSEKKIEAGKYRICLEYQIGNCAGPCEGKQTEESYLESVHQITQILKGNLRVVKEHIMADMQDAAREMAFERAMLAKQRMEILDRFQSKSTIVTPNLGEVDVFSIASNEKYGFVNHFKVAHGTIIQSKNIEIEKQLPDEEDADLLQTAVLTLLDEGLTLGDEIITSSELILPTAVSRPSLKITIPKLGDKRKLLDLSQKNALFMLADRIKSDGERAPETKVVEIMKKMQSDLRLPTLPKRIECFDNSNLGGTFAVAAMVCFINTKPAKREYRHFNIKTVQGPDDFASMAEIVYRRYSRVLEEGTPLPDLIVVDGGKGQLSSAVESLTALGLNGKVPIIGIAKNLEELFYPDDPIPLLVDKRSYTLKIIQQLRDEAHRFGITHHRNKRSKAALVTELDTIPGIGASTAEKLLITFRSVAGVKAATEFDLYKAIGQAKAKLVVAWRETLSNQAQ
jgi:excinuclease ABC subunit C